MPKMGTVGNIALRVYADDTKKHKRPHFHAVGPDDSMVISLPELEPIEGALAPPDHKRVMDWAKENKALLIDTWNKGNPSIPVVVEVKNEHPSPN